MKCTAKSFSIDLIHDQSTSTTSSSNLLPLNVWFWNTILFLWFQINQVKETHQHFHLVRFLTPAAPSVCCRKWSLGLIGNAIVILVQDRDSHHRGRVQLQLKNRCSASSSLSPQNGHNLSFTNTWRLIRFIFVGNLSLISLQAKVADLAGIFNFHRSSKSEVWSDPIFSLHIRSYPLFYD